MHVELFYQMFVDIFFNRMQCQPNIQQEKNERRNQTAQHSDKDQFNQKNQLNMKNKIGEQHNHHKTDKKYTGHNQGNRNS